MSEIAIAGSLVSVEQGKTSQVLEGTSKLFINGKRVAVVGDKIKSHTYIVPIDEQTNTEITDSEAVILTGNPKLIISGKEVAIVGSMTTCGEILTGSNKLIIS